MGSPVSHERLTPNEWTSARESVWQLLYSGPRIGPAMATKQREHIHTHACIHTVRASPVVAASSIAAVSRGMQRDISSFALRFRVGAQRDEKERERAKERERERSRYGAR